MKSKLSWATTAALAVLAVCGANNVACGQVKISSKALEIKVTGRVHAQWNSTSVSDEISNLFFIRRARLTAEINLNDFVEGKIQPDYALGVLRLKDAYVDLVFDPAFRVRMGQFKRGFDWFELESSTRSLVIERTGAVRGVDTCAGVGRICSYSRFTEALKYSDRDIGISFGGLIAGKWLWSTSVTNGEGPDRLDTNDSKSFSGRLEFWPQGSRDLMIAANVGAHDYVQNDSTLENDHGIAFGVDLNWGSYDAGLHVQGGVVAGDNWKNLNAASDPSTFVTGQGIVGYKLLLPQARHLESLEGVARLSWGDPDTDAADNAGFLFTPGIVLFFTGRNKIAINADIWLPEQGDTEVAVRAQSYLHF